MKNKESICIDINCPLTHTCVPKENNFCWFSTEWWQCVEILGNITPFEVFVLKERWAQRKKNSS